MLGPIISYPIGTNSCTGVDNSCSFDRLDEATSFCSHMADCAGVLLTPNVEKFTPQKKTQQLPTFKELTTTALTIVEKGSCERKRVACFIFVLLYL